MTKKRKDTIKYLENLLNRIDKSGGFWDYQVEYNSIKNCIDTLKSI